MSKWYIKESKIINAKSVTINLANQETSRNMSKLSMKESKIINVNSVTRNLADQKSSRDMSKGSIFMMELTKANH